MWHVYNLLQEGDSLRASTLRKVVTESGTGTTAANKVRTMLTIAIESIDYDFEGCLLRVKGKNVEENQYVKLGQYHTIDIELNRKFTLKKEEWDLYSMHRLELACDPSKSADLAAIVMDEGKKFCWLIFSVFKTFLSRNRPRLSGDAVDDAGALQD